VQAKLLPITDRHLSYAKEVEARLKAADIRVELDGRNEKVGFKIREAELQKIPYMLIIGDREVDNQEVSVRHKGEGNLGTMAVEKLLDRLRKEIENKQ